MSNNNLTQANIFQQKIDNKEIGKPLKDIKISLFAKKVTKGELELTNPQVELSNLPSDWRPNPFDNKGNNGNNDSLDENMLDDYKYSIFHKTNSYVVEVPTGRAKEIINLGYGAIKMNNFLVGLTLLPNVSENCNVKIYFYIDGSPLENVPEITLEAGKRCISLTLPLFRVKPTVKHVLAIRLETTAGTITLPKEGIQLLISGQGAMGGSSVELPHAEVIEKFFFSKVPTDEVIKTHDNVVITLKKPNTIKTDDTSMIILVKDNELNKWKLVDKCNVKTEIYVAPPPEEGDE